MRRNSGVCVSERQSCRCAFIQETIRGGRPDYVSNPTGLTAIITQCAKVRKNVEDRVYGWNLNKSEAADLLAALGSISCVINNRDLTQRFRRSRCVLFHFPSVQVSAPFFVISKHVFFSPKAAE